MTDNVYIFDKLAPYTKRFLGEIQTDFNMSFVIDGTKYSCKILVFSFAETQELEANTILWHENTNTWWIIDSDKVEKYVNEIGSLYMHEISLIGAKELLNARDLTDCGFNQNRYTVEEVINRLFALSNFEFNISFSTDMLTTLPINLNQKVDFVKTYQNYTLLSALRDFLDGYNCSFKMDFALNLAGTQIAYAVITIISKTGSKTNAITSDYFNDVKEIQNINRDSFGTVVVSNAENVISTREKTYPRVGSVKPSSSTYLIDSSTALIRLPSKAFKVNWVKILTPIYFKLIVPNMGAGNYSMIRIYPQEYEYIFARFEHLIDNHCPEQKQQLMQVLENNREAIIKTITDVCTITIFDGNNVDPTYNNGAGQIIKGDNVPYLAYASDGLFDSIPLTLVEKNELQNLPREISGIAWERGSNIISHFNFITGHSFVSFPFRDTQANVAYWGESGLSLSASMGSTPDTLNDGKIVFRECSMRVNYIPMSDLKIKIDNQREKNDIQLYNQNGKLTDSRALSKLLNSYSKEISSDTITKYYTCYKFSDVAPVGTKVLIDNEIYVVNNLSIDFTQNENGYLLECEYTMSKQFAVKSIMVNPNTNIRDYGIPQNFNVERKQLYRDYFEITYVADENADNSPYISDYNELFNFTNYPKNLCDYTAIIKLTYAENLEGSDTWYYQLDTTKYELDKMIYVVLTFNDNNIIGYGSQNVYSGFVPSRLLTNWIDTINTPISYVDKNGELQGIEIAYVNSEDLITIYDDYKDQESLATDKALYNFSVFVPQYIYDLGYSYAKLRIGEQNYNKDALEVPIFEYAVQIGDSEDVLIGDNILCQEDENYIYLYNFRVEQPYYATTENATPLTLPTYNPAINQWHITNSLLISLDLYMGTRLQITCYAVSVYDEIDKTIENTGTANPKPYPDRGNDVVIFRHAINKTTREVKSECIMVLRNIPSDNISGNIITLNINQYTLK